MAVCGAAPALAADPCGEYVLDSRGVVDMGPTSVLTVSPGEGGQLKIVMVVANPALCGGSYEGQGMLENNVLAVESDMGCTMAMEFSDVSVRVTLEGGVDTCNAEQCPMAGVYYRRGVIARPVEDLAKDIRAHYAYINENLSSWDESKADVPGMSTEGGQLTAYVDLYFVKKIIVELYGEMGRLRDEYYFFDNSLVFVYSETHQYDKPFGETQKIIENRYYFHDGIMLRWLDLEKKEVPADSAEFKENEDRILREAEFFRQAVEDGKDVIEGFPDTPAPSWGRS